MKLLIMQFSPVPCHLSLFGLSTIFSALLSDIPTPCSCVSERQEVSQPHKSTSKIIALFFIFLYKVKGKALPITCQEGPEGE